MPCRQHDDKKSKKNDISGLPQEEKNFNTAVQLVVGVLLTTERGEANLKRNEINGADDVVMECHSRQGVRLQPSKYLLTGAIQK